MTWNKIRKLGLTLVIVSLFSIGFYFRFANLGWPDYTADEMHTLGDGLRWVNNDAYMSVRHHTFRHPTPSSAHPFLFPLLNGLIFRYVTAELSWGRMISAISGLITVLVIYLIGKNLYSKRIGLIGALLLILSPYHTHFSRDAHFDSFMTLLTTLLAYVFGLTLFKGKKLSWLAGIIAGLIVSTKYSGWVIFLWLTVSGLILIFRRHGYGLTKNRLISGFFFGAFLGATFLVFNDPGAYLDGILHPSDTKYLLPIQDYGEFIVKSLPYYLNIFVRLTGVSMVFLFISFIVGFIKKREREDIFLVCWFIGLAPVMIFHLVGVGGEYGLLLLLPPFYLMAVKYLSGLKKELFAGLLVIMLIEILARDYNYGYYQKKLPYRREGSPYNRLLRNHVYGDVVTYSNNNLEKKANVFLLPQTDYPLFALRKDLTWSYYGNVANFDYAIVEDESLLQNIADKNKLKTFTGNQDGITIHREIWRLK